MNILRPFTIQLLTMMLLLGSVGCAAFRPIKGIPARFLPTELQAESRSQMETLNPSLLGRDRPAQHVVDRGDILGIYIEGVLGKLGEAPPVNFPIDPQGNPTLGFPMEVRDDGTISLPLAGSIDVRGMTVRQVEEHLRDLFVNKLKFIQKGQDRIIVTMQKPRQIRILVLRQEGGTTGSGATALEFASSQGLNLGRAKRGSGKLVYLPVYRNDVLNAITEAGGLPGLDAENAIYVIRRPQSPVAGYQPGSPTYQHLSDPVPMVVPTSMQHNPQMPSGQRYNGGINNASLRAQPAPNREYTIRGQSPDSQPYSRMQQMGYVPQSTQSVPQGRRLITPVNANSFGAPQVAQPSAPQGMSQPGVRFQQVANRHQIEPVFASGLPSTTNAATNPQQNVVPYTQQQWQAQPVQYQQPQYQPQMVEHSGQMTVHPQMMNSYQVPMQGASPTPLPEYPMQANSSDVSFDWFNQNDLNNFNPTVHGPNVIRIPVRLQPGERPQITLRDITLNDGDVVFIESRETEIFYTAGLLGGGQFTLPRDYDLRVVEAISMAQGARQQQQAGRAIGGVSALNGDVTISASNVIIMRWAENGTQVPIKVDLHRAITSPQENILIKAGDVVMLRYSAIEAVGAFIERNLLEGALFGVAAAQLQTTN